MARINHRTNVESSIFISHVASERDVAIALKQVLEQYFVHLEVFVSSAASDNGPGEDWLGKVFDKLRKCQAVIVICSPESMSRPWINFEAGAGWIRNVPVIPICHSGLPVDQLPLPFRVLQTISATSESSLVEVVEQLAKVLGTRVPAVDFKDFIKRVKQFELQRLPGAKSLEIFPRSRDAQIQIGEKLNQAKREIWLSGVQFAVSLSDWRGEYLQALARGVKIRCAFLDPDSPSVDSTARYFSMTTDELRSECADCVKKIARLNQECVEMAATIEGVGSVEARTYKDLPRARYYLIDPDESDGLVIYVPYVEGLRSSQCPAYVMRTQHEVAPVYVGACKDIFRLSTPL